jgi:Sulfotransferase family
MSAGGSGALGRVRARLGRRRARPRARLRVRGIAWPERPTSANGLSFDLDDLESRLVWVWGTPRSGSSWLLHQLVHPLRPDPRRAVGFEGTPGGEAALDIVPVDESFIPNHLAPQLADPREVDGMYVPGTLNNYLGEKPAYVFSREYADVWRPEARRFALVRLNAVLERAQREGFGLAPDARIVIKEGNGSHAADLVMSLLPRSRAVFLVRDGRDVVDSLMHAYAPGGFLARNQGRAIATEDERAEGVRWAARMWACNVDVTRKALGDHSVERQRTLRYEDLLADTEREMTSVFEWLELERDSEWVRRMVAERSFEALPERRRGTAKRNRSASPGLWRENLSPGEQAAVAEIMGERLVAFGYEA